MPWPVSRTSSSASYGFKWWDEETGKFDLANPRMAEGLDTLGEFIRYAGPDQFAGMRQVEGNGHVGRSLQCRHPEHDHRRLLASGRNPDSEA